MTRDGIGIRVDWRKLDRGLRALAVRVRDMGPVARDFGAYLVRRWTQSFARTPGWQPSAPGTPPAVQSGEGRASLTYEVRGGGETLEAGTVSVHMAKQHGGGEILPRKARALAVPLSRRARGKRPRDIAGLHMIPIRHGTTVGLLVPKGWEPHGSTGTDFVLKTRVDLPARPWLEVDDEAYAYLGMRMERHLAREGG